MERERVQLPWATAEPSCSQEATHSPLGKSFLPIGAFGDSATGEDETIEKMVEENRVVTYDVHFANGATR